jgi:hypothetical protein
LETQIVLAKQSLDKYVVHLYCSGYINGNNIRTYFGTVKYIDKIHRWTGLHSRHDRLREINNGPTIT